MFVVSSDVLACLRETTRARHDRLDRSLRVQLSSFDEAAYAMYLSQMRQVYGAFELAHRPYWSVMAPTVLNWAARSKVPWIAADLEACAPGEAALRPTRLISIKPPHLPTQWSAWGAAYVIEGSTLGGRVLLRNVAPKLIVPRQCTHRFWTGYGRETGAQWKIFLAALQREAGQKQHLDEVLEGALCVFDLFLSVVDESFATLSNNAAFPRSASRRHFIR